MFKKEASFFFQKIDLNLHFSSGLLQLKLDCRKSPWGAISIKGRSQYRKDMFSIADLSGSVGKSSFSRIKGTLEWNEQSPDLAADSDEISLNLEELQGWGVFSLFGGDLARLKAKSGTIILDSVHLEGPAEMPSSWSWSFTGKFDGVSLQSPSYLYTVHVYTGNWQPQEPGSRRVLESRN